MAGQPGAHRDDVRRPGRFQLDRSVQRPVHYVTVYLTWHVIGTVLGDFVLAFVLNGVLTSQILYYGFARSKTTKKD